MFDNIGAQNIVNFIELYDSDMIRTIIKPRGERVITTAVINNVFLAIAICVVYLKIYLTIIYQNSPFLASIYMCIRLDYLYHPWECCLTLHPILDYLKNSLLASSCQ